MKIFTLIILLLIPCHILAFTEQAAFGTELGVARLSDGHKSMIGTSWMFHFEYQADPIVGFFGQSGLSEANEKGDVFKQTTFLGGLKLNFLPQVELRLGIANELIEIEKNGSTDKYQQLGPMAGLAAYVPMGGIKLGTSATVIRTKDLNSTALRLLILIVI
jgi:hypothetical protein